jgi:hypothetical protein
LLALFCCVLVVGCVDGPVASVDLGTADGFAILAGSGITNVGTTMVVGDVGSHPTPAQTGFGPGADSVTVVGTNHHDDAITAGAKVDLVAAYNDAKNRTGAVAIPGGDLGGLVLTSGVYSDNNDPDSLSLTGTLTLDGLNDTSSVFIFQSGSTLVTASNSSVILINGAQACRIFWQVTSSATLGTDAHLEGTILALTSITLDTRASVDGRALARNGAVTLHNNTIQRESCDNTQTSTAPIPVFPTTTVAVAATAGAMVAAFLILRRRPGT